jgi:hypothetical protein
VWVHKYNWGFCSISAFAAFKSSKGATGAQSTLHQHLFTRKMMRWFSLPHNKSDLRFKIASTSDTFIFSSNITNSSDSQGYKTNQQGEKRKLHCRFRIWCPQGLMKAFNTRLVVVGIYLTKSSGNA